HTGRWQAQPLEPGNLLFQRPVRVRGAILLRDTTTAKFNARAAAAVDRSANVRLLCTCNSATHRRGTDDLQSAHRPATRFRPVPSDRFTGGMGVRHTHVALDAEWRCLRHSRVLRPRTSKWQQPRGDRIDDGIQLVPECLGPRAIQLGTRVVRPTRTPRPRGQRPARLSGHTDDALPGNLLMLLQQLPN